MRAFDITGENFHKVDFFESVFDLSDISVNDDIMKVKNVWGITIFNEPTYKTYKYLAGYAEVVFRDMVYAVAAGYDNITKRNYIKQEWGDAAIGNTLNKEAFEDTFEYEPPDGMEWYVIGDVLYYDEETDIEGGLLYIWCKGECSIYYEPKDLIDDEEYIHNVQKYTRPKI